MTDNFYWCLNPNSSDTGGLLMDDWVTTNEDKLDL
jgi:endoglucanase